jgi:hypothetical protein
MAALLCERTALSNAPNLFVAGFWRDFYRSMLTHARQNARRMLPFLILFIPLLGQAQAPPPERLNIVIAVDLSVSVASTGHDGKTDFEKNLAGVTSALARVPPTSQITVLGITEESFSQPYVLLSAKTTNDSGYFGERIAAARRQLIQVWQRRSARLKPRASRTDILGALVVAGHFFDRTPRTDRRTLIVFSDMLQVAREVNLETKGTVSVDSVFETVERGMLVARLNDVEVHVLGVSAAGNDITQWEHARRFWTAYFAKAGAMLTTYSILREPPALEP